MQQVERERALVARADTEDEADAHLRASGRSIQLRQQLAGRREGRGWQRSDTASPAAAIVVMQRPTPARKRAQAQYPTASSLRVGEGAGQQRSRRADKDADKTRCSSSTLWTLRSRNHSNKHAPDRIHKNHVRRHITRDDILSPPATPQTWACGACSVVQAMLVKLVAQPRRKNAARQRERQGAGRLARGWATRQPGPRGQLRRGGGPRSAGRRRACARRPSGRGGRRHCT